MAAAFDYVWNRFRGRLAGLDDPIGPAFGPYATSSTADLGLHVLDEFIHHAAEVSLLRDLYRHRESLGRG
jgi:hypothetical protein